MRTDSLPESGFVRLKQIIGDRKRGIPGPVPVSRSTWYEWVRLGRVAAPIHLGPKTSVWRVEDIRAFIEAGEGNGTRKPESTDE